MSDEETPDMVYGRMRESVRISIYTFTRMCEHLEYLLTEDRWQQVGAGYPDVNAFLRSIDLSAYRVQETRPELVQRIKELQPEASNRAIAEALGVSHVTVNRDLDTGTFVPHEAEAREAMPCEVGTYVPAGPDEEEDMAEEEADDAEDEDEDAEEDEEELPAFLCGDGWTTREWSHAYGLFHGLPAALQWTVEDLLNQPGICVPDIVTMLEHISGMDDAQRADLVRLQASPEAYERSCAITFALNRPPPPHPRVMLLYDARRELVALSRRVESAAARDPELPGAAELVAWAAHLAALAEQAEALIDVLHPRKEVPIA